MNSDPLSDMLARIRNALAVYQPTVLVPASRLKIAVAKIMVEEGYLERYEVTQDRPQKQLRLWLKYSDDKKPILSGLKRISKPGRRLYTPARDLPRVLSGIGVAVISTSRGVMSDKQARRQGLGGEVLCHIW
ncbi:MAG: 30S ribosomal protein S8 [Chloroflexi bacterium]|nr:30S ribosomal protein S8 [Chloroflexota bacterium]